MNHFFLESRGREKLNDIRKEGLASQMYHRSGGAGSRLLPKLAKLALVLSGILAALFWIIR